MASSNRQLARLTGPCLKTESRSGTKNGEEWEITTSNILVNSEDVTQVTYGRNFKGSIPQAGEFVDFLVEVSSSQYGLRFTASRTFPADQDVSAAA